MILDIPELLVKVAQYADWRAILALQRLNRGAYRDRPALVQATLAVLSYPHAMRPFQAVRSADIDQVRA